MPRLSSIDLDHVAVAVHRMGAAWPRYGGDLAGTWVGGSISSGFASAQVAFANGMRLEVLEPHLPEANDFLRRFLDRNGPGPHHLTFKVPDLRAALDVVRSAGHEPVGVALDNPWWKEAFLHPKGAHGVVVQLAQAADWDASGQPVPEWFPQPRVDSPATLVHVAHAVADAEAALALFRDLLGGETVGQGEDGGARWVDLAWPGPGRVRLLSGAALAEFLEGRAGRVHHLAFACEAPGDVAGSVPTATAGLHEIAPDDNLGTRLVLAAEPALLAASAGAG